MIVFPDMEPVTEGTLLPDPPMPAAYTVIVAGLAEGRLIWPDGTFQLGHEPGSLAAFAIIGGVEGVSVIADRLTAHTTDPRLERQLGFIFIHCPDGTLHRLDNNGDTWTWDGTNDG